jgi:DNA-binding Xre family transcriptional regulator
MTKNNNTEVISSFDEFMSDPESKELFAKAYKELVLSELIISLMEEDEISVRKLAKLAGLSPTIIQELRTGKKDNVTLKTFSNIVKSMGYKLYIKKGRKQIPVEV